MKTQLKNVCRKAIVFAIVFLMVFFAGCSAAQPVGGSQPENGVQPQNAAAPETTAQPDAAAPEPISPRDTLPDTGPAQIAPDVSFETIETESNGIVATGEVAVEDTAKDPGMAVGPKDGASADNTSGDNALTDNSLVTVKVKLLGQAAETGTITVGLTSETLGDAIIPPEVVTRDFTAGETVLEGDQNTEFDFTFKAPPEPVTDLVVTCMFAPLMVAPEIPDPPPIPPQSYTTSISIPLVNGNAPAPAVANPPAAKVGETVKLPAVTANAGFTFNTWRVTSGGVTITNPNSPSGASFVMGSSNVGVEAVFVQSALTFANQTLPNGTFGVAYSANVTPPTGGSGLFTYTATMPFGGLTMSQNGAFSGTPNAVLNAQTFNVTVTDTKSGASATAVYTITILRADQSLTAAGINTVPESSPINLSGHATSSAGAEGGVITYTVANAGTTGAVINGTKLSFENTGTAIIRATAPGGTNFNKAEIEFMLTVTDSASASISPASATFDRYPSGDGFSDIQITINPAGNTLKSIQLDGAKLSSPGDYSVNGNVVILKKEYLRTLAVGDYKITFMMNAGRNPELSLTVVESYATPDPNQPQDDSPAEPAPPAGGSGIPAWVWVIAAIAGAGAAVILIWRSKQCGKQRAGR